MERVLLLRSTLDGLVRTRSHLEDDGVLMTGNGGGSVILGLSLLPSG